MSQTMLTTLGSTRDGQACYVLEGAISVGSTEAPRGHALVLGSGELLVRGRRGARFAYLRGRPHQEPILHREPLDFEYVKLHMA